MNQLPENSLRIYDVTLVTSYLIGLTFLRPFVTWRVHTTQYLKSHALIIVRPIL